MLALINGERGLVSLAKAATESLKVLVANDDGSALDITGGTIDVVVYDRSDRLNAAIAMHSGDTLTTPAAGLATVALPLGELTYGPGDYYAVIRYINSGATITWFSSPFSLSIR